MICYLAIFSWTVYSVLLNCFHSFNMFHWHQPVDVLAYMSPVSILGASGCARSSHPWREVRTNRGGTKWLETETVKFVALRIFEWSNTLEQDVCLNLLYQLHTAIDDVILCHPPLVQRHPSSLVMLYHCRSCDAASTEQLTKCLQITRRKPHRPDAQKGKWWVGNHHRCQPQWEKVSLFEQWALTTHSSHLLAVFDCVESEIWSPRRTALKWKAPGYRMFNLWELTTVITVIQIVTPFL